MQKLAVVYFPKLHGEKIDTIRAKYDPQFAVIPPHITIVFPLSNISESQLARHIEAIAKEVKSFSIHLTGLTKSFDDYLFLLIKEGNEEVTRLHNKLYSGILAPYFSRDIQFNPHITLGYFRTKQNIFDAKLFEKAYEQAQKSKLDMFCDLNALSIIKGDGISPATIIQTCNLS